jgi:hypothetical protein
MMHARIGDVPQDNVPTIAVHGRGVLYRMIIESLLSMQIVANEDNRRGPTKE